MFFCSRSFFGHSGCQLMHFHEKFGASPRELQRYAQEPSEYEAILASELARIPPGQLSGIICGLPSIRNFHLFITTKPSEDRRDIPTRDIASQHVFDLLWEQRIKYRTLEMADLYNRFSVEPTFPTAAGLIFEYRMHQIFANGAKLQVFPIPGRRVQSNVIYDDYTATLNQKKRIFWLTKSAEYLFGVGEIEETVIKEDQYYHFKTREPAVDSFFLYQPRRGPPILLVFRITPAKKEHGEPIVLSLVDHLKLPPELSNPRKIYIVVTPEGIYPDITTPMGHSGPQGGNIPLCEVFHYPVSISRIFRT